MEERRITHMYFEMVAPRVRAVWEFVAGGGLMRSGMVTATFLALIVGGVFFLIHERGKQHLTHIKQRVKQKLDGGVAPVTLAGPKPGGMDPLTLTRPETPGITVPEFASVTMLPGLGMSVLQITAYIPGRGEVPLLIAPTLESLSPAVSSSGTADLTTVPAGMSEPHGELELPWADVLGGAAEASGKLLGVSWQGRDFTVPRAGSRDAVEGGLLGGLAASNVATDLVIDGGSASATFDRSDFDGHWPGTTRVKVTVLMVGTRMELTVLATNAGAISEPMGIGWMPRFALTDRAGVVLKVPEAGHLEMGSTGLPTGRIMPAAGALSGFSGRSGAPLGDLSIDESLVQLKPGGVLEDGPMAELRFPEQGYGIRMAAISSTVHALRVDARAGNPYVLLGMATNYPDPLGREWPKNSGSEMVTLMPGQSLEWRVRLDIFALADHPE